MSQLCFILPLSFHFEARRTDHNKFRSKVLANNDRQRRIKKDNSVCDFNGYLDGGIYYSDIFDTPYNGTADFRVQFSRVNITKLFPMTARLKQFRHAQVVIPLCARQNHAGNSNNGSVTR